MHVNLVVLQRKRIERSAERRYWNRGEKRLKKQQMCFLCYLPDLIHLHTHTHKHTIMEEKRRVQSDSEATVPRSCPTQELHQSLCHSSHHHIFTHVNSATDERCKTRKRKKRTSTLKSASSRDNTGDLTPGTGPSQTTLTVQ